MTLMRPVLVMMAALMLGGCAAITSISDATRPLEAYELRAPSDPLGVQGSLQRHLVIETPVASGALDTDRIMIRPGPLQTAYLPGARWVDTAPVMMQTILVRSLNDTNALRYVGRRPLSGSADYVLISELTDFRPRSGLTGRPSRRGSGWTGTACARRGRDHPRHAHGGDDGRHPVHRNRSRGRGPRRGHENGPARSVYMDPAPHGSGRCGLNTLPGGCPNTPTISDRLLH